MYLLVTKYNLHISVTPKNGGETDIEVSLVKKKGKNLNTSHGNSTIPDRLDQRKKNCPIEGLKNEGLRRKKKIGIILFLPLPPIERVLVQRHRPRISQQSLERDGKKKTRKASTIGFHRAALTNYQGKAAKPLRRGNRPSLEAIGRRHRA